jgi:hypothetical protein
MQIALFQGLNTLLKPSIALLARTCTLVLSGFPTAFCPTKISRAKLSINLRNKVVAAIFGSALATRSSQSKSLYRFRKALSWPRALRFFAGKFAQAITSIAISYLQ